MKFGRNPELCDVVLTSSYRFVHFSLFFPSKNLFSFKILYLPANRLTLISKNLTTTSCLRGESRCNITSLSVYRFLCVMVLVRLQKLVPHVRFSLIRYLIVIVTLVFLPSFVILPSFAHKSPIKDYGSTLDVGTKMRAHCVRYSKYLGFPD